MRIAFDRNLPFLLKIPALIFNVCTLSIILYLVRPRVCTCMSVIVVIVVVV